MGKDIQAIYVAHVNIVNLYFNSMEGDINHFVDNVYAPYQIGLLVEGDMADFQAGLNDTLAGALKNAPNNTEAARIALENMEIFISMIRKDIESYRNELLTPIQMQRMEIIDGLDNTYMNLISANESITAHLSSIKKVKETQGEMLEQLGIDPNFNEEIGQKIADLSSKVNGIITQAENIDINSDDAIAQFKTIKDKITSLNKQ